jgi:hypothetical protein
MHDMPRHPGIGAESSVAYLKSFAGSHLPRYFWSFDSTQAIKEPHFPPERLIAGAHGIRYVASFTRGLLTAWGNEGQPVFPVHRRSALLLDSDVAMALRLILVHGHTEPERLAIVLDLAEKSLEWQAEVQIYPYLRQMLLIAHIESKVSDIERATEALLRFQTLDIAASVSSKSIKTDQALFGKMERYFEASGYVGCAKQWVAKLLEKGEPPLWGDMIATYALILQLIWVGIKESKKSTEAKIAVVDEFIRTRLIQAQPRFFVLARLFFKRKLAGMLKTGPGEKTYEASRLVGGAWDIYQTTIHEPILGESEPPTAILSILCTRDKALADYAGHFPLRGVMALDDGTLRIHHDWEDGWLKDMLGESLWRDLVSAANSTDPMNEQVVGDPERICEITRVLQDELAIPDGSGLLSRSDPKHVVWAKKSPGS